VYETPRGAVLPKWSLVSALWTLYELYVSQHISLANLTMNKQFQKRPKSGGSKNKSRLVIPHPMQIQASFTVNKTMRYIASGALNVSLTLKSVMDLLVMATGTTTSQAFFRSLKISRIELWGPPGATPASVSVRWLSGGILGGGPEKCQSDTSIGTTEPAYVRSKPPVKSLYSDWIGAPQANTAFVTLIGSAGTVVDFTFSAQLNSDASALDAVTLVGATSGVIYARPLDGTGGVLVPQDYPSL
jgi:hypothetical protein